MKLILFYCEGLQSHVNYLAFLRRRPDLFCLVVEMPAIPKKKSTGKKNYSFLYKIFKSSYKYIGFNFLVITLYTWLSRVMRTTIYHEASKLNISYLYQPSIDNDFINKIREYNPLYIINGTSTILNKNLINIPEFGVLNLHGAPLPEYRGAANYIWMINDEIKEAFSTLHYVDEGLDSGPIIMNGKSVVISKKMSVFELWMKVRLSADKIFQDIEPYIDLGKAIPNTPQDESKSVSRSLPSSTDINILNKKGHYLLTFKEFLYIINSSILGYPIKSPFQN